MDTRKVFVIHGRNLAARDSIYSLLQSIGLSPIEWNHAIIATGSASPQITEIIDAGFFQAQALVVLLTPDEEARLKPHFVSVSDPPSDKDMTGQARLNVIFEAGLALARFPTRTLIVQLGGVRPFSDLSGLHVCHLNNSPEKRQEFATKLKAAGCPVNTDGIQWLKAGEFEKVLNESATQSQPVEKKPIIELKTKPSESKVTLKTVYQKSKTHAHTDYQVLFAWWLFKVQGVETFTAEDLLNCYDELRLPKPSNIYANLKTNVEKQFFLPVSSGSKTIYKLSIHGEEFAEDSLDYKTL